MTWFRAAEEKYGYDLLDQDQAGTDFLRGSKSRQCYRDAFFINEARNGSADEDIDLLLKEVRWLRRARLKQRVTGVTGA